MEGIRPDFERLFAHLDRPEPPAGLLSSTMARIRAERDIISVRRRVAALTFGFLASLAACVPAFAEVRRSIAESGFMEYLSLLFSDGGAVMTYWSSFAYTLVESLPAISVAALLAAVLASLGSLKYLIRNMRSLNYEIR